MQATIEALAPKISDRQDCKRCGSDDLITQSEPPHLALRCRACGAWQRWLSKGAAKRRRLGGITTNLSLPGIHTKPVREYPETLEAIRSDFTTSPDLKTRVEQLERAFAGYDLQLTILTRAVLACGMLKGSGTAAVHVED